MSKLSSHTHECPTVERNGNAARQIIRMSALSDKNALHKMLGSRGTKGSPPEKEEMSIDFEGENPGS